MAESVSSGGPIICEKCAISFKARKNLYGHIRKFHPEQDIKIKCNQLCGLCDCSFRTIALLREHLQNHHSVTLQYVNKTFYSEEEFLNWKVGIENETKSSFIIRNHSDKKEAGKKLSYYICHRSGCFKSKGERIRNLKASGSIKSGSTCPAAINVSAQTVDGITEISVCYQSVHVGHKVEIGKLRLSKNERACLATSLKLGIPMDKIVDETRENFSPTSRFSLITRKDLHNITRDFRIRERSIKICKEEPIDPSLEYQNEVNLIKSAIRQDLKELELIITDCDTLDPLPAVHEKLKSVKAMLEITSASNDSSCKSKELTEVSKAPQNKYIIKQEKFEIKQKGKGLEKSQQ